MYSGRLINKVPAMTITNLLAPSFCLQQGAFLSCVWVGAGELMASYCSGSRLNPYTQLSRFSGGLCSPSVFSVLDHSMPSRVCLVHGDIFSPADMSYYLCFS